jgi:hypothetical protein
MVQRPRRLTAGRQRSMARHQRRRRSTTTFWLSFTDPEAPPNKRFLGVAIFDMDESKGELSVPEIVLKAHQLGINPGGQVLVQEVEGIPDEYKNKLITDDALLLRLGSRGRANTH